MKHYKYIVSQSFETLGVPCRSEHYSREKAEQAAETLRGEIAAMVAEWDTPDLYQIEARDGIEGERWSDAEEIAGVEYEEDNRGQSWRTDESPKVWGIEAGQYIADRAVQIEEEELDCLPDLTHFGCPTGDGAFLWSSENNDSESCDCCRCGEWQTADEAWAQLQEKGE